MTRLIAFLSILFCIQFGFVAVHGQAISDSFDRGVALLREKKYEQAAESFQASLRVNPDRPETMYNLGFAFLRLGRAADAVRVLRQVAELRPSDGKLLIALCDALAADRKPAEGLKSCEEGARLGERTEEAELVTLSVMKAAGISVPAINYRLETALARAANNLVLLEFAADHYYWTEGFERSAEYWDRLTKIDSKSGYYFARLAMALLALEREAEALSYAKHALELDPSNPFGHYFMGRLFLELGQNGDASAGLEKARAAKEKLPDVQYYYALSESRRGRKDVALNAFREAIRHKGDDYPSNYELGILLSGLGRFEEAIPPLRKALALRPRDFDAKLGLGLVLFESTQFTEAILLLEEANRLMPGNEVVMMFLRVARSRQQGIPQLEEMMRAARRDPRDDTIRVHLIELLAYARRIDEAEPFVKEFIELKSANIRDHQRVAVAFTTAGKTDRALEIYQRALRLGDDPGTYMGVASIFASRGQVDQASAAYAKTLALKPDSPGVMKLYADHLRDNGKRREALDFYKQVLGFQPNDGPTLASAAILAARLGEVDLARAYAGSLRLIDARLAARIEKLIPSLRYSF